jgi:hypothetical protein
MLEQIGLALALVLCLVLAYRRLAPQQRTGGCHVGRCGEGSTCASPLARLNPRHPDSR